MRFRQFITDNPLVLESMPPNISGVAYADPLGMSDLNLGNVAQRPGEMPPGGYSNISQVTQSTIAQHRYGNREKYIEIQTLQKIGVLANNIVIIILQKDPNKMRMTMRYRLAEYDKARNLVYGIPIRGLISDGGYPELRPQDLHIGKNLKVIIKDPHTYPPDVLQKAGVEPNAEMLAIDVNRLKEAMAEYHAKVGDQERQYRAWDYLGGEADRAFNLAAGQGQMSHSKGTNPLSGS